MRRDDNRYRLGNYELLTTDERLVVRMAVPPFVVLVVMSLVFIVVGVGFCYAAVTHESTPWYVVGQPAPAMRPWREHSVGDRVATIALLTVFCGTCVVGGVASLVAGIRARGLAWVIDRGSGTIGRGGRRWKAEDVAGVQVLPMRRKLPGVRVCVCFADASATPLTVASFPSGRMVSPAEARGMAGELAGRIGAYTGILVVGLGGAGA